MISLLSLVKKEGLFLSYKDLYYSQRKVLGLYYYDPVKETSNIVLDTRLEHNLPLHRSVLAEELGHHFTAPQASILNPYTSYNLKLKLSRDEAKAIRWACNYLMPEVQFWEAVEMGYWTLEELAEYFAVTPWLVQRKLEILERETPGMQRYLRKRKIILDSYQPY